MKDKLKNVTNSEIEAALKDARNVTDAAKLLGVSKQALYACVKIRGKQISPTLRALLNS